MMKKPEAEWAQSSWPVVTAMVIIVGVLAIIQLMMMLRSILQPLLFAIFLVMILVPIVDMLKSAFLYCSCRSREDTWVGSVAHALAAFLVLLMVMLLICVVGIIVFQSLVQMRSNFAVYQKGALDLTRDLKGFIDRTAKRLHLKDKMLDSITDDVVSATREMLFHFVGLLLSDLSETMIRGVLCLLYLIFWLCQPIRIDAAIDSLFRKYIMMKTVANICTGVSTGLLLFFLKVDMAWMFALVAFVLNYIPEIGPLIAICLPIPVIMFDGRLTSTQRMVNLTIATLGQLMFKFIFGNVLELKMIEQDRKMRMHPVIVLLGVAFFGYIWGPTGMLLSVPLMALFKLFCINDSSPFPEQLRNGALIFLEGDVHAPERYSKQAEPLCSDSEVSEPVV